MEREIVQKQDLIKENQELKTKFGEIEDNAESLVMQIEASRMQMVTFKEKFEMTGNENRELRQALKKANKAGDKRISLLSVMLYGNVILNVLLLVIFMLDNPKAINEILISGKSIGIGGIKLISDKLQYFYAFLNEKMCLIFEQSTEMASVYTYVVCVVIVIIIVGIGYAVCKRLIRNSNHRCYYKNKGETYVLFKKLVSIDIVIVLYAIYVTQFERINIFFSGENSLIIWGKVAIACLVILNLGDLIKGFES